MQDDWRMRLAGLRSATTLLRDILDVQDDFRAELGGRLTVNATDLAAMELLIARGPMSPSALAGKLGLTTAGATSVVDRLAALNHVSRQPNPDDRRSVRVVPNPRSVETAVGVIAPMIVAVDDVLDRFAPEQQRAITEYLEGVARVYRAHASRPKGVDANLELDDSPDSHDEHDKHDQHN